MVRPRKSVDLCNCARDCAGKRASWGGNTFGAQVSDRTNIELAKSRLPMTALLKLEAPDWKEKNPVRDDKHGNSFSVTPEDNGWNDNATGDKGDQIDFLGETEGLEYSRCNQAVSGKGRSPNSTK